MMKASTEVVGAIRIVTSFSASLANFISFYCINNHSSTSISSPILSTTSLFPDPTLSLTMLVAALLPLLALAAPIAAQSYIDRGDATFYNVGDPSQNDGHPAGAVACSGDLYSDDQVFVALSPEDYQYGGNCGKWVWVYDINTHQIAYAPIVDMCASCEPGHIDLSPALWNQLHGESFDDGKINVRWGLL
jgi:uncharacterized membrane protein